jgi:2-polyprenyl-6-methoxyphenol hydroxylase-like FAD-dependent oxidoreductase
MAKRNSSRVVIVGGGIAGPALGMFLRRIGLDVVLYERRSSEAVDEGLFLGVAPNGMNVLVDLDMHTAVERVGVPCHGFEFQNARGHVIGRIDRADDEARFGVRLQMVRRGDLHRVLTDRASRRCSGPLRPHADRNRSARRDVRSRTLHRWRVRSGRHTNRVRWHPINGSPTHATRRTPAGVLGPP